MKHSLLLQTMKNTIAIALVVLMLGLVGCFQAKIDVAPIKIEPIEMNLNINVKIQKEVDKSMDFLYGGTEGTPGDAPKPQTQPVGGQ